MSFQQIKNALIRDLPESSKAKSSHWLFHTRAVEISSDYKISGIHGFSNRTQRFPGSTTLHKRNLKRLFPWATEKITSLEFKNAIDVCHAQSREVDTCVTRNYFTLELLENFDELKRQKVCVIGDGQANFVSLAIARNFCEKLISVNLTEVLLSDLELIENLQGISATQIAVATNKSEITEFFKNPSLKLLLISAQNASILTDSKIDLFVNIASFQEMTPELVFNYFKMIASNNAYLYSCNRIEKKLYGGEVNRFFDYPWGHATIILDESCKWHQYAYSLRSVKLYKRFPFDGEIWHRLVKF